MQTNLSDIQICFAPGGGGWGWGLHVGTSENFG